MTNYCAVLNRHHNKTNGGKRQLIENWKSIAWNGIQFNAPLPWEIGRIGSRQLILEEDGRPVMEVKWAPVKGNFSHKAHLKRLVASQSKNVKGRIAEWFLPPPWQKALAGFETRGFSWQTEHDSGRGAILFCQTCRHATLIQFFGVRAAKQEMILLTALKSLQDHRQDGRILWSIFDIKVKLPETLRLLRYRFEAGRYELEFNDGSRNIHLHRWAPAAAILGGRDLAWFSRTIPGFAVEQPPVSGGDDAKSVEWSISPSGRWRRLVCSLKIKPSHFWFRLWHLEDKNRILGVRAESKHPLDFQILNRICAAYESL